MSYDLRHIEWSAKKKTPRCSKMNMTAGNCSEFSMRFSFIAVACSHCAMQKFKLKQQKLMLLTAFYFKRKNYMPLNIFPIFLFFFYINWCILFSVNQNYVFIGTACTPHFVQLLIRHGTNIWNRRKQKLKIWFFITSLPNLRNFSFCFDKNCFHTIRVK